MYWGLCQKQEESKPGTLLFLNALVNSCVVSVKLKLLTSISK